MENYNDFCKNIINIRNIDMSYQIKQIVKEEIDKIVDIDTLEEMLVFIKNEKGRPEAEQGEHDDLVMALAIVYYIRSQQTFKMLPAEAPKLIKEDYSQFGVRNNAMRYQDYGSEIPII